MTTPNPFPLEHPKLRSLSEAQTERENMKPKWTDATTYSQDDRKQGPNSFALKFGELRLSITSAHIYYRGKWVMHCAPFYHTHPLAASTLDEAKCQAVALVQVQIEAAAKDLARYIAK